MPQYSFPYETRFGLRDIEVQLHPRLKDGTVLLHGMRYLWIGTRPPTLLEEVGREARLIVRRGMADILEWLGEPVEIYPTGREVYAAIRRGADPLETVRTVKTR